VPAVRTLKIVVAYDGTDYVGWQRQPNGLSIQGLLEDALAPIEGRAVNVAGAGRTDAGVHALGQVASVRLASPIEAPVLVRALNARLPSDVRVVEISEQPPAFHARFDARAKTYQYRIREGPLVSPFEFRYVWHQTAPLDDGAMRAASARLVGRHDFSSFQVAGSDVSTTERTIIAARVDVNPPPVGGVAHGRLVTVEIEADGFLRHMARSLVGTLVEVGQGRRSPEDLSSVLEARDRSQAGATAPARGLFLMRVTY
jgi:tRNA pseudouridine38-40 synthase